MVIFHTDHWGALAQFIVLALTRHSKEERVYVEPVEQLPKEKKEILSYLVENGIFTKVVYTSCFFPGAKLQSEDEIISEIVSVYDNDLKSNGVDVKKAKEIYTFTDFQGTFRLYLLNKRCKYIQYNASEIEIDNSRANICRNFTSDVYVELLKKNHVLDGDNKYCKSIIALREIRHEKYIKFDFIKEQAKIDTELKEKILRAFNIDFSILTEKNNLLLSNSIADINGAAGSFGIADFTLDSQILMYQKLVDYFYSQPLSKLLIKSHPNNWIKWDKYFPDVSVIQQEFPIEMVCFDEKLTINELLSVQTSAADKIDSIIENSRVASRDFVFYFQKTDVLYTILKLYLNIMQDVALKAYGMPMRWKANFEFGFFESFLKNAMNDEIKNWFCSDKYDFKPAESFFGIYYTPHFVREINSILGLSRVMDENSAFAVFPVSEKIPVYTWPQFVLDGISVFRIERTPLREDILQPLKDEYIWIFSKSQEIRNKIEQCYVEKNCEASGVVVKSRALTAYEKKLYFDNYILKNEVCTLRYKDEIIQRFRESRNDLQSINSIDEYLIALSQMDNIAVFIAVMGNAGRSYTSQTVRLIEEMGLEVHWNHLGWNTYVAVVDSEKITEQCGDRGKPSEISGRTSGIQYNMASKSYAQGDDSVIRLNGIDYAVKARGVNVVVYDKAEKKVIDSVCFNPFGNEISFSRRYL